MASYFHGLLRDAATEYDAQLDRLRRENDLLRRELEELQQQQVRLSVQSLATGSLGVRSSVKSALAERQESHEGSLLSLGRARALANTVRQTLPMAGAHKSNKSVFQMDMLGPRSGLRHRLGRLFLSPVFEGLIAVLVLCNVLVSAAEMQYLGLTAGYEIRYPGVDTPGTQSWAGAQDAFQHCEHAFTAIFTLELLLRLAVLRCTFFLQALNWLDLIAVTVSLVDVWLRHGGASSNQASVLRMLRLVRLARGLRIVRVSKVWDSLHFLLQSIKASVATLFWSLCVLTVIQCVAGMILSQLVQAYINGEERSEAPSTLEGRRDLYGYYGTFTRTMITMFEVHFANWAPACRVLVDNAGEWLGFVFLAYRCFAGFAVLNVINAVFVQQTMKVAQQDHDVMIMQKQKAQAMFQRQICELFEELDTSGDGLLTRDEFDALVNDSRLKAWMGSLEVDMSDVESLFEMLRGGQKGGISNVEFAVRLLRIKGPAKGIDMAQLLMRTARIESKLEECFPRQGNAEESKPRRMRATIRAIHSGNLIAEDDDSEIEESEEEEAEEGKESVEKTPSSQVWKEVTWRSSDLDDEDNEAVVRTPTFQVGKERIWRSPTSEEEEDKEREGEVVDI